MEQFYEQGEHKFLVKRIVRLSTFKSEQARKEFCSNFLCIKHGEDQILVVEPVMDATYTMVEPSNTQEQNGTKPAV
jgi:hypothetical protein